MNDETRCTNPGTDAAQPFEAGVASRRTILLMGLGLLAGCAESRMRTAIPGPAWPSNHVTLEPPEPSTKSNESARMAGGVIRRSVWAKGQPVPALMNRMLPVRYITVHHAAMLFTDTNENATAAHLESIRRGHRGRGWGDIGYHFAVDRAGRVWEARPLSWQGAHVANKNESNLGIVTLGNFDEQSPSNVQLDALRRFVTFNMRQYNVPLSRVKTHQEWAPTRCPGTSLQRYMVSARSNGTLG